MTIKRFKLLIGVAVYLVASISMAEIYRYKDENGHVVLDRQGVPAQYIGQGYEVLNKSGQVIRTIPRALTAEEHQARIAAQRKQEQDRKLLQLYNREEDLNRAKTRKLAEIDGQIRLAEGGLQTVTAQKLRVQQQAATHERAGREVPEHLLIQVRDFEQDETRLATQIQSYKAQRAQLAEQFERDRQQLQRILSQQR